MLTSVFFKTKHLIFLVLIISYSSLLFSFSADLRKQWYGKLSPEHHHWITAHSLLFLNIWEEEGPLEIGFSMPMNPASVEFPSLEDRIIYSSYPPGAVAALWIAGIFSDSQPDPAFVMGYNLFIHLMTAILLGVLVYIFLASSGFSSVLSFILALLPPAFHLFMPAPMYFQQNVYFTDNAVILPVVLILFLQVYRMRFNTGKYFFLLEWIVAFWGTFTDWFFIFLYAGIFVIRIINKETEVKPFRLFLINTFKFWAPVILAVALFIIQIISLGVFRQLWVAFLRRTGYLSEDFGCELPVEMFFDVFIGEYFADGYGAAAPKLFLLVLAAGLLLYIFNYRRDRNNYLRNGGAVLVLFSVPFILHSLFFRCHSVVHDFSVLKYSLSLAIGPFVLLPALTGRWLAEKAGRPFLLWLLSVIAVIAGGFYVNKVHPGYREFFPEPEYEYVTLGSFLRNNTDYEDLVISPHLKVRHLPPQQLSLTMKRVYEVHEQEEIDTMVRKLPENYKLTILIDKEDSIPALYRKLIAIADVRKENEDFALYKVNGKAYDKYREQINSESVTALKLQALKEDNLLDLVRLHTEAAEKDSSLINLLEEKIDERVGETWKFTDSLYLIGYDFVKKGKEDYQMRLAFRNEGNLETDWHIFIQADVPPQYQEDVFHESGEKEYWDFTPEPGTSSWDKGYRFYSRSIKAKDISYYFKLGFYSFDDDNYFQLGETVELGWIEVN